MRGDHEIRFFNSEASVRLRNLNKIKELIRYIFIKENQKLKSLNIVFCSDNELLKLNKTYLSRDYFTDVITFTLGQSSEEIIGEIYISLDRVRENAIAEKIKLEREVERVIIHGVLHLCGYKDKTKKDKSLMKKFEDYYLERLK